MGKKSLAKTPPKKESKTGTEGLWRSPRIHGKTRQIDAEPKRGDGPVGRGGMVRDQFLTGSQGK